MRWGPNLPDLYRSYYDGWGFFSVIMTTNLHFIKIITSMQRKNWRKVIIKMKLAFLNDTHIPGTF